VKPLRTAGIATAGATVLAPIAWGTTYTVVTETLPAGRPLLVAAARVVPAGLALVAGGTLASRWRPRGAEWARTAVLALFNFGFFFPLLIVAVYRLPGGVAAAAGGLQPLLVATGSWPATGHRPRARDLAVGLAAALGVALVVIRPGADLDPVGVLAAVAANVSFAAGVVLTRRLPAPAPAHRLAATGWQLLLGGVMLVPLALAAEGRPPALTGGNVIGFAYLSLVGTALAFLLWFEGIRRLPAAAPPLLGLAAPVTGALLGWVILRQSLSPVQLAGFVLTLGAIAYGAVLGASAAVGDDGLRETRTRVAHPVDDDHCVAVGRAGSAGSVEGGSLVGGEFEFDRGQTLVQLGDGGGADQRDHGNVTAHQPGQDDLVGGRSGPAGDPLQRGLAHRGTGVVELGGQGLVATHVSATQQG
jgi:probable blue pigment (indigoidine) exporter